MQSFVNLNRVKLKITFYTAACALTSQSLARCISCCPVRAEMFSISITSSRLLPLVTSSALANATIHTSACDLAARKYIRIKRMLENRKRARLRALQKAAEPPKKWVPAHIKIKLDPSNLKIGGRRQQEESLLPLPPDDVFFFSGKREPRFSLSEIVSFFRVSHDESMLDEPNSLLSVLIDFDLRTAKKTKFVSPFSGIIANMPHPFGFKSDRIIAAVCKDVNEADRALEAGATYAGSQDIIKDLTKGVLKKESFDELVVSSDMLVAIAGLRGILKEQFPTKTRANYGPDVPLLVKKFKEGIFYQMKRDDFDPAYGFSKVPFARLNMEDEKIEENLDATLAKIDTHRSLKTVNFIYKVAIECDSELPDAIERYVLKHWDLPSLADSYSDPFAEPEEEAEVAVNEGKEASAS